MNQTSLVAWWRGARPPTLAIGAMPVLVGTAAAGVARPWRTLGALVVALGLQAGVNYLNDYEDGVRGIDNPERLGPARMVASGLASARAVRTAGLGSISIAAAAGLLLASAAGFWLAGLGAACILAALAYSGGPRPYSSAGLGELSVFVFFGLVATCATTYVQAGHVPARAWWAACSLGALAVAALVANNLRDISTDQAAGKRTLAVRIGEKKTRTFYQAALIAGVAIPAIGVAMGALPSGALLTLAGSVLAVRCIRGAQDREPIPLLKQTAAVHAVTGMGLALGLWTG